MLLVRLEVPCLFFCYCVTLCCCRCGVQLCFVSSLFFVFVFTFLIYLFLFYFLFFRTSARSLKSCVIHSLHYTLNACHMRGSLQCGQYATTVVLVFPTLLRPRLLPPSRVHTGTSCKHFLAEHHDEDQNTSNMRQQPSTCARSK